ncbi:alpha/beta hydrolase family protein [Aureispira anguillae]|uniref:Alpha/beta hydrolase n=1 Tax=Aureispira anguillae TaxID=2864201 RepID=A0A915YKV3_9BACT|nr:alpha/beta hydrolase [Aureispira anguillae]BDS14806.1 alpha/beta hydrolase [Aureispira anguillae]
MNSITNYLLKGQSGKPVSLDVYWSEVESRQPIVIFAHGFKGFKDWGHWQKIAIEFVKAGYCFIKFNFSHNGTTPEDALNFSDLEAFGQNNYTKELEDLQTVIDWVVEEQELKQKIHWNVQDITLIGHSRGGPIALIGAKENEVVQQVITWASVHELDYSWHQKEAQIAAWKEEGVHFIMNGRTKQKMPLYYQLYENYKANEERLSVQKTLQDLDKPYLILHGGADPAVPASAAEYLQKNAKRAELHVIEAANHVFGGVHPYQKEELPLHSKELVQKCLDFLKKTNKK